MTEVVFKNGWVLIPKALDDSTTLSGSIPIEGPLLFEFKNLRILNSYGIRFLIQLIRNHSRQTLEFHNCPSPLIESINIVQDLLGPKRDASIVKSFELPYACEACRQIKTFFVNTSEVNPDIKGYGFSAPICSGCANPMEIEIDEKEYLEFLVPARKI